MGLFTTYVAYKVGKSRGKRSARNASFSGTRDPDCINYQMFCSNYGSCDGQVCEYPEDSE